MLVLARGQSICYLDNTDGGAVNDILRALPEETLEDVIVLDHSDQKWPIGIGMTSSTGNLFTDDMLTGQWVSFFESNFEIESQYMTQELISYACKAVFGVPGTTLLDVVRLVKNESYRNNILNQLDDWKYKEVVEWWNDFEKNSEAQKRQITASFLRRAGLMFRNRFLRYTLGQVPKTELNYRKWMDEGKIVLIKAPESLGNLATRIIMAIHVIGFWQGALSRDDVPEGERPSFMLIADEPQTWLSQNEQALDDIYSKARKYGFGIVSMFQSTKQVKKKSSSLLDIIFDNNPDLFAFHTSKKIEDYYNLDGFDPEDTPKYHFLAKIDGTETFMAEAPGVLEKKREDISRILKSQKRKFNQHYLKVHKNIERRWQKWEEGANIKERSSELQQNGSKGFATQDSPKETECSSTMSQRIEL